MSELEELKAAINEPRDIEALKALKCRYCHLVDARRWDELLELWTEDAVCDYGFFGTYAGRDEIVNKFFRELVTSASSFNAHMVHNPLIEVPALRIQENTRTNRFTENGGTNGFIEGSDLCRGNR